MFMCVNGGVRAATAVVTRARTRLGVGFGIFRPSGATWKVWKALTVNLVTEQRQTCKRD